MQFFLKLNFGLRLNAATRKNEDKKCFNNLCFFQPRYFLTTLICCMLSLVKVIFLYISLVTLVITTKYAQKSISKYHISNDSFYKK